MPWLKLSDDFADGDVDRLSDTGFRAHVSGLLWTMRITSDGVLGASDVRRAMPSAACEAAIDELVDAGLWERLGDGAVRILHAMPDQRTKAEIEAARAAGRARVRRHRERTRNAVTDPVSLAAAGSTEGDLVTRPDQTRTFTVTNGVTHGATSPVTADPLARPDLDAQGRADFEKALGNPRSVAAVVRKLDGDGDLDGRLAPFLAQTAARRKEAAEADAMTTRLVAVIVDRVGEAEAKTLIDAEVGRNGGSRRRAIVDVEIATRPERTAS